MIGGSAECWEVMIMSGANVMVKSYKRLHINLNEPTAKTLEELGDKQLGLSATEVVRQAVAIWKLVMEASKRGAVIRIVERDGTSKDLFVP